MNEERSYFERSQSGEWPPFDPELQFEKDLEAIIRASREQPKPERKS